MDHTLQASPKVKISLTSGARKQDRTFFGAHHSRPGPLSPVVWGNRIFVTSAVSSDPKASFVLVFTVMATLPKIARCTVGSSTRSINRLEKLSGNKLLTRASHARSAISRRRMQTRHPQPTVASSLHGSDRKVFMLTTSTDGFSGRLTWSHRCVRRALSRMGPGELADHLERSGDPPV